MITNTPNIMAKSGLVAFLSILLLLAAGISQAQAAANLMVTPTRIVFDQRDRTAQVTLMNTGTETGSFRISFTRQKMTETGQFITIEGDEPGLYADTMVRYSPRQITLPPGQSQVVRLMLRKPRELEDGEYRSHMLFQALPKPSKSSIENVLSTDTDEIKVEIIPIVGISIPVIVLQGKLESNATLSNARIIPADESKPARIALEIHRTGNRSSYGDFRATFTPKGGLPVVVALANGVAVYTPNAMRQFEIPLNTSPDFSLAGGTLRIVYLESGKDVKTGLLAETSLQLD